jgi:hypothetical protein
VSEEPTAPPLPPYHVPAHLGQYHLRGALAGLDAVTAQLPNPLAQLRAVARLSDADEEVAELRYLAVDVVDVLPGMIS